MCSLLLHGLSPRPVQAAQELVVRLDGMELPFTVNDLGGWLRNDGTSFSELGIWLNLLEEESRQGVIELLQAPLINDRSMARQMLNSWAGRRLWIRWEILCWWMETSRGRRFRRPLRRS